MEWEEIKAMLIVIGRKERAKNGDIKGCGQDAAEQEGN
jgi:hypothetical protein